MSQRTSRQNSQDIFTGEALTNPIRNVPERPASPSVNSISHSVDIEVTGGGGDSTTRTSFIQNDRTPLLRHLRYLHHLNVEIV